MLFNPAGFAGLISFDLYELKLLLKFLYILYIPYYDGSGNLG